MLDNVIFTLNNNAITGRILLFNLIIPIVFVIACAIALFYILGFILSTIQKTHRNSANLMDAEGLNTKYTSIRIRIRRIIRLLTFLVMLLILLSFLSKIFYDDSVFTIFTKPFYQSGNTNISLLSIFLILMLGYISYWFSALIRRTIKSIITNMPDDVSRRYSPLVYLVGYASLILTFIMGLSIIGINISSFTVLFGVVGVGLGFGLQDIVANFFSGLVISVSRIITEGDRVFIQGIEGDIQQINAINTVIRNITCEELIVPNRFILNEAIQNYSHSDSEVIVGTEVGVDYSSDMYLVEKVLLEVGESLSGRIGKKGENVFFRFKSFGDSGIIVGVYVKISDVRNKYQAISDLHMLIWKKFQEAKITIPFPQVDLHIKEGGTKINVQKKKNFLLENNVVKANTKVQKK